MRRADVGLVVEIGPRQASLDRRKLRCVEIGKLRHGGLVVLKQRHLSRIIGLRRRRRRLVGARCLATTRWVASQRSDSGYGSWCCWT